MITDKLSEQILQTIARWIVSGELSEEGRLPSIKQLVELLGVSAVTVREALVALQTLGIVEMKHGKGIYVSSPDHILEDFFRTRVELETLMARKAATDRSPEILVQMHDHVANMEKAAHNQNHGIYGENDGPFHSLMFKVSGLYILGNLVNLLKDSIFMPTYYMSGELQRDPNYLVESNKGHWEIYSAMEVRDPDAAESAIHSHLDRVHMVWHRNMNSIKLKVKSELAQVKINTL